ncbi:MAG: hypothetical protein GOV15_03550 [Candidatus Diapherotrites archaeon]|nr:hypothetical protein [Candidatus Diapherotrites archaeon]
MVVPAYVVYLFLGLLVVGGVAVVAGDQIMELVTGSASSDAMDSVESMDKMDSDAGDAMGTDGDAGHETGVPPVDSTNSAPLISVGSGDGAIFVTGTDNDFGISNDWVFSSNRITVTCSDPDGETAVPGIMVIEYDGLPLYEGVPLDYQYPAKATYFDKLINYDPLSPNYTTHGPGDSPGEYIPENEFGLWPFHIRGERIEGDAVSFTFGADRDGAYTVVPYCFVGTTDFGQEADKAITVEEAEYVVDVTGSFGGAFSKTNCKGTVNLCG